MHTRGYASHHGELLVERPAHPPRQRPIPTAERQPQHSHEQRLQEGGAEDGAQAGGLHQVVLGRLPGAVGEPHAHEEDGERFITASNARR